VPLTWIAGFVHTPAAVRLLKETTSMARSAKRAFK
jgi:hypothetical protein